MPNECCRNTWAKIPEDEPVFILRGQDKLAARVIQYWLSLALQAGVNDGKLAKAGEHLWAVSEFQMKHPTRCKVPD